MYNMHRSITSVLVRLTVAACVLSLGSACVYNNKLSVPRDDSKCRGIGGSCVSKSSGCSNGRFVAYHCPGSPVCCVPTATTECDRHLISSEGNMYLEGYIPSSGSGVTIASGVDIGQRLPREYAGLDRGVYRKLVPYMAIAHGRPRNKNDVCSDPSLNRNRLQITLNEAITLDDYFKTKTASKNSQYTNSLSRGKCVIRSLNHYCGSAVLNNNDNKCNYSGCTNYIKNALITTTATDSQFKNALKDHRDCIIRRRGPAHVAERFRKEICYIDSSESIC